MRQFTRYVSRMFLVRFAVVLFAVAGFALLFDMLDVSSKVLRRSDGVVMPLLRYMALRLPTLLTELLPVVTLVASLLTVVDLLRYRELVVMWNAGLSRRGLLLCLWPVCAVLLAGKFLIDDRAVPSTIPELRAMRVGDFKNMMQPGGEHRWVRSGQDAIRLPADAAAEGRLEDLLILHRDEDGLLLAQIQAARAEQVEDGLLLHEVVRRPAGAQPAEQLASLPWPVHIDLAKVALMSKMPRELRLTQLVDVVRNEGFGIAPDEGHRTVLHSRIASSLGLCALALLPFALPRRFSRLGMSLPMFAKGLGLGFVYLIFNGVLLALGEVGLVQSELGAWLAPLGLILVVLLLAGIHERRAVPVAPKVRA
ncbi:LptF/LptG family permease [Geminicoccaceae bacterium 1502E]|nr:LptF/LptG family permease [Geminicoccaceae bacterium 1502E]